MAVNVNQVGFERRLTVVQQILHGRGLQTSNVSTLAYDEQYQYPFNNYLFRVELAVPAFASSFPGTQPGTCRAPSDGVSVLVIKLSNPAAHDVNNANRVANDVAAQNLVRQAMAKVGMAPLVPDIYAWASATTTDVVDQEGFGWIISELRSGVDLDSEFSSLALEDKKHVLEQIAAVVGAIQAASLPEGVTKFGGGLKYDSDGHIVSGESPCMQDVKPCGSYAEWRAGKLCSRFDQAAESPIIRGWKSNDVATRIEMFLSSGGPEKLLTGADMHRKCLIHGDLTTNNMLYDRKSKKVTAVLDFDFASVSHLFEEFMSMSFSDMGGNVGDEDSVNTRAILSGDFTTPPADLDEESATEWELAKTWNAVLQESAALAPSQIEGVDEIRELMRLQRLLCPYHLSSASALEKLDANQKTKLRAKAEADLLEWLEKHGF
ncbi:hypothetical protein Daus18300_010091 [Diaporthe australafricana]|uniref:non-specific serine/threonine protein kinase n=1 Tax=Diaporthe australafricana TaxID=127596 RepID=A0ABR3WCB3_9PEZI